MSTFLFEAQREENGAWRFGSQVFTAEYRTLYERDWEQLIREQARLVLESESAQLSEQRRAQIDARLAEIKSLIARIDAQDAARAERHHAHWRLRQRARALARDRVLDFAGAPAAQMQLAGRLWGHCCRCGKELTDPVSLERGIGPDCVAGMVSSIRSLTAAGRPPEVIAILVGTSIEFVNTVAREAEKGLRLALETAR